MFTYIPVHCIGRFRKN